MSDDLVARLARCERPTELPADWLLCGSEACRRAIEARTHTENAKRHHRCADLIDDVKQQAEEAKEQNP